MPLIRKILFWIATAVYAIACPLLILYSLGYIYNPVIQKFESTGIIRLASMPADADVFFEKGHYKNQTPTTIRGVLPGEYQITLRKKGYRPWSHTIRVEGGKAVAFDKILLIPENWPTKELSQVECQELIPVGNKQLLLVTTGPNLSNCFILEKNKQLRPLLDPASQFAGLSAIKVYHTAKSDVLIAEDGSFWNRRYLYINTKELPADVKDITALLTNRPDFIRWDAQDPTQLYTAGSGCINLIDVKTKETTPCYLKDVRGFGVYDGYAYALDANSTFLRMAAGKKEPEVLSQDPRLNKQLFGRSDFYEISGEGDITLFLGTGGELITPLPPYHISDNDIVGFEFGTDKNLLLYWSRRIVGLADFAVSKSENIFKAGFKTQTLHANARNIRQCFWAYKDSHILFSDDDMLYLIEIEPQGQNHVETIGRIRKGSDVMYAGETGTVYYLDADSGRLEERRIIPKEAMTLIPLAD